MALLMISHAETLSKHYSAEQDSVTKTWSFFSEAMLSKIRPFDGASSELFFCILAGSILGLVVIVLVSFFPGEPCDYDPKTLRKQLEEEALRDIIQARKSSDTCYSKSITDDAANEPARAADSDSISEETVENLRRREINTIVEQLPREKLQNLLGVDQSKLQEIIEKAKSDALAGRSPEKGTVEKVFKWIDYGVYGAFIIALLSFACYQSGSSPSHFLHRVLPTESEVVTNAYRRIFE